MFFISIFQRGWLFPSDFDFSKKNENPMFWSRGRAYPFPSPHTLTTPHHHHHPFPSLSPSPSSPHTRTHTHPHSPTPTQPTTHHHQSPAHFLAVAEHRLFPTRARNVTTQLRNNGISSVWALARRNVPLGGHARVGVVSLHGAPLTLPTLAFHLRGVLPSGPRRSGLKVIRIRLR